LFAKFQGEYFCHAFVTLTLNLLPSNLFAKTTVWLPVVCKIPDNQNFDERILPGSDVLRQQKV
jgi:hypothetical protein